MLATHSPERVPALQRLGLLREGRASTRNEKCATHRLTLLEFTVFQSSTCHLRSKSSAKKADKLAGLPFRVYGMAWRDLRRPLPNVYQKESSEGFGPASNG